MHGPLYIKKKIKKKRHFLFSKISRTALRPTEPPFQLAPWLLGLKRAECDVDHSSPSSAELNEWSYSSPPPISSIPYKRTHFSFPSCICVSYVICGLSFVSLYGSNIQDDRQKHVILFIFSALSKYEPSRDRNCRRHLFYCVMFTSLTAHAFYRHVATAKLKQTQDKWLSVEATIKHFIIQLMHNI